MAHKGFIFTLDAVFSLIVASAAMSILLYMNFATPSYQAQQNQAMNLLQNMLRTTVGQISQGQSLQTSASGYNPIAPFGYANFLQSPAGYIQAVAPTQYVNSITVSFWIDPMNNSYWGNPGNYWQQAVMAESGISYYFYIEAGYSPPVESWSIKNIGGTNYRNFPGTHLIPDQWQQLVGTYNGSDLVVYLDGSQIGSPFAATGTIAYNGTQISGADAVSIGGGANPISGGMADVQVYANALTPSAVSTLYNEGIGGAPVKSYSLLGWWPLNGNAADYAGSTNGNAKYTTFVRSKTTPLWGYNATANESVLHMLSELYLNGQAAEANLLLKSLYNATNTAIFLDNEYASAMNISYFDGTSAYVQANSTASLNLGSEFTFSAWINPESLANCGTTSSVNCMIFNKENSYEWGLASNGQLCWAIHNSAPGWTWICPQIYVSAGKWSHVALTYNGSAVTEYLDGTNATPYTASGAIASQTTALRIGARGAPGAAGSFFLGDIANVQMYNTSLSHAQVGTLYYDGVAGLPVEKSGLVGWWPLDGNANDYSGNGNSGNSIAVQYTQIGPKPIGLQDAYSVSKASAPVALEEGGINKLYNVSVVIWK